ncbi:MAG: nucleoside-diphosphate kinase [Actinomycetota bacterium]|nr:nucleoside-diphosphate kinase [Actinomycetota bacterium]
MSRTLVMVKPDGVERGLVGEIVRRLEAKGLRLVAAELRLLDEQTAGRLYDVHRDKPFFAELVAFVTRSPAMALVVDEPDGGTEEGSEETWKVVRTLIGATNPRQAAPGTIRGDLGLATTENLVHGSDSTEAAAREISVLFPDLPGVSTPS